MFIHPLVMRPIYTLLQQLEATVADSEKLNTAVSQSPVGWHIQHALLVIRRIASNLEKSDPVAYKWTFNRSRSFVFTFKKIPRGKARAPKPVQPVELLSPAALLEEIQLTKTKLQVLDSLHRNSNFEHPYLGLLNLKATRKFLFIHTKHHVKIIEDILKGRG